ncbi:uncharacterized protein IWZ02DRAFT_522445 [Phyllosticta citriasiana]|uniref:uncharacterized protein n=1 Tax=Phyllosticta citriasiana TaxID=595635 RepID=UPI0030FDA56A
MHPIFSLISPTAAPPRPAPTDDDAIPLVNVRCSTSSSTPPEQDVQIRVDPSATTQTPQKSAATPKKKPATRRPGTWKYVSHGIGGAGNFHLPVASTSKCSEWLERVSRPGASLLPSSPLNPFRQPAGRRDATDATDLTPAVSQSESPPARNDGMLGTVAGSTSCFSPRSAGPLPLTCLSALRISDPSSGRGDQVPGPRAGGLGPGWT